MYAEPGRRTDVVSAKERISVDEAFLDVTGSVAALAALDLLGSSAGVGSSQASFGFAKSSSVLVYRFGVYKLKP